MAASGQRAKRARRWRGCRRSFWRFSGQCDSKLLGQCQGCPMISSSPWVSYDGGLYGFPQLEWSQKSILLSHSAPTGRPTGFGGAARELELPHRITLPTLLGVQLTCLNLRLPERCCAPGGPEGGPRPNPPEGLFFTFFFYFLKILPPYTTKYPQ